MEKTVESVEKFTQNYLVALEMWKFGLSSCKKAAKDFTKDNDGEMVALCLACAQSYIDMIAVHIKWINTLRSRVNLPPIDFKTEIEGESHA